MRMAHTDTTDLVVLLDDDGRPTGTAPRATVHTTDTPLHLAFSCYLFDDAGRLLLTRRAVHKRTWPGVWTNSFCGHPRPGEDMAEAVHRYARHELGAEAVDLESLVPAFRYRATDAAGIVENELCPVYAARWSGGLDANPEEVADLRWLELDELRAAVAAAPWALSPWLLEQVAAITAADGWAAPVTRPAR
jgi:isopentenyl-diphosphate delta-isomerase